MGVVVLGRSGMDCTVKRIYDWVGGKLLLLLPLLFSFGLFPLYYPEVLCSYPDEIDAFGETIQVNAFAGVVFGSDE